MCYFLKTEVVVGGNGSFMTLAENVVKMRSNPGINRECKASGVNGFIWVINQTRADRRILKKLLFRRC